MAEKGLVQKKYKITLSLHDVIDVMFMKEKNTIHKFALNYRAFIENTWEEVYRVDNYHGFLHEQKFWICKLPIPIQDKENVPLKEVMAEYLKNIHERYQKYRLYFANANRSDKK
jgi:hypothetical protein